MIDSTLPGVAFGSGQLKGDNTRRVVAADSDGCTLDTFSGTVYG